MTVHDSNGYHETKLDNDSFTECYLIIVKQLYASSYRFMYESMWFDSMRETGYIWA